MGCAEWSSRWSVASRKIGRVRGGAASGVTPADYPRYASSPQLHRYLPGEPGDCNNSHFEQNAILPKCGLKQINRFINLTELEPRIFPPILFGMRYKLIGELLDAAASAFQLVF